ncbi:SCP2 sterol-binding domain-containing protein [Oleiagrimonas sp.]|jgi:predicted lipid carrier protein YhbT/chorismate mutase|uniref:ubiquinone anaerobic biosynthesis accessory factor UbiT n=1 Tax=Oleiagrimonas sp. TaxID=2010330 RepID=UPI002614E61A|nr:SCP2 sterol-binding domain-containing protein [Oleiagrimonas sp.]MDA3914807.1 SCP2 sterol-binding domain-containing protein [Oleiagrimonas sp.]
MSFGIRERMALAQARSMIDRIDDGLLVLLAARRKAVRVIAAVKVHAGMPTRDATRERSMRTRANAMAERLDLPWDTAQGVLDLAIADACRQQDRCIDLDQGKAPSIRMTMLHTMIPRPPLDSVATRLLRLLPPPHRMAPLLRLCPRSWQQHAFELALAHVLKAPLAAGDIEFMQGRRLGIEVSDLNLQWVLELRGNRLQVSEDEPEASVRGRLTDLLLLAGRLEDADTLFFQRRLELTGDTELGLTARNMLDRLPYETMPLGLRVLLNRGARLARAARTAHGRESLSEGGRLQHKPDAQ